MIKWSSLPYHLIKTWIVEQKIGRKVRAKSKLLDNDWGGWWLLPILGAATYQLPQGEAKYYSF